MNLWLAYIFALIRRKKKLLFGLILILVLVGLGFYFLSREMFKRTLTEGFVGTYQERDLPVSVTSLISDSLVKLDKSGLPQKNLVDGWEVNSEATEYTFSLKPNLKWTDGTQVRSSEIDLSIPDVEVSYPDDSKIKFKIADSFSPFPTLLTKPILKKGTLIGVGSYSIGVIKKDGNFIKRLTLVPVNQITPQIVIKFYPNEKIAKTALKLGEIESLFGVNEVGDLRGAVNIAESVSTNYEQLVTIFYNTKDPILSDDNFRLGLSYAAPVINDEVEATTSLPPNSWAFNGEVKDFLDKSDQAKAALAKVKNGRDTTITLTVTNSLKSVGERVVEAWNKAGVKAVLRVESGIPQNFQALLITQNIPADPDQYSLWHSTQQETNISKYASPRIDKDLEDGRKLTDLETRKARYQDFQKTLLDHAPATFLYFPKYNVMYVKKSQEKVNQIMKIQLPQN